MKSTLVIGSLNMDMVLSVSEMPKPGQTVIGNGMALFPGGKGANQAYALSLLGGNARMAGAVGADENGRMLIDQLKRAHVDVSAVAQLSGENTGLAVICVDAHGNNQIIVTSGANARVAAEMLPKALIQSCDLLLLQLEIPLATAVFAAKLAKALGKTVILNPAPAPQDGLPEELYQNADILLPNETELEDLSGMRVTDVSSAAKAARRLIAFGTQIVVVTLGAAGALLVTKDEEMLSPSFHVSPVVDTTGAGDCFAGALVAALSRGDRMADALRFANMAAAIAVTRRGAMPSYPTINEVNAALNQQKE